MMLDLASGDDFAGDCLVADAELILTLRRARGMPDDDVADVLRRAVLIGLHVLRDDLEGEGPGVEITVGGTP